MNMILLNADVGEGMRNDANLMPFLSYANIACGGHFGTSETILKAIQLAQQADVKVGAHPSYPDLENFGRKSMQIPRVALEKSIKFQIDQFLVQCSVANVNMHHIKLHGALYNDIFNSVENTQWFLDFVEGNYPEAFVFVPVKAQYFVPKRFESRIIVEAFADRSYTDDLSLVSRSNSKAILGSIKKITTHVSSIINGKIITVNGNSKPCKADTLCVHGDHPLALEIVTALNSLEL